MWNPMTRARNLVTRLRAMSESLSTLQQELTEVRSSIAFLQQATSVVTDHIDRTAGRLEGEIERSRSAANLAAR